MSHETMLDREKTERLFHHQADRMHQLATMHDLKDTESQRAQRQK